MSSSTIPFTLLAPGVAIGSPAPDHWQPADQHPLIIIVGVTGVGKSTMLGKLAQSPLRYTLLPNRRDLTDRLIISHMQAADGAPIQPVTDRKLRFDYTRRYRQLFSGGMSHALTQLWLDPSQLAGAVLFDGLRGAEEVGHAVRLLPSAQFIVLHAPDVVRVQRLLQRNDAFDQITTTANNTQPALPSFAALGLPEAQHIFDRTAEQTLLALVHQGAVTADDLRAKLQIVVEERRNYDPVAALDLLQSQAPARTLVIDTTQHAPEQVVTLILERFHSF